jgi:hypothetical protein
MIKDVSKEGAGDELSEWVTPAWCVDGLVDHWPELIDWSCETPILEPSAGTGGIVRALVSRGAQVEAIETRDTREQLAQAGACRITIADFCQVALVDEQNWFITVMNPPYRPPWVMLRHMRRALEVTRGFLAALLPLSFLSGGSGRNEFWEQAPPLTQLLFFDERPAFAETGGSGMFECAWFIWKLPSADFALRDPRYHFAMICAPVRGKTYNW